MQTFNSKKAELEQVQPAHLNSKKGKRNFYFSLFLALFFLLPSLTFAQPSGFSDQDYISGWDQVVGFTFDDNSRMYVWEKAGKVWIVENGVRRSQPLIDISEEVGNWRDFGLVGFTLDPNFLSNGYIYLLYTVDRHHLLNFGTGSYNPNTNEYFDATIGRVSRYTAQANNNFNTVNYNSRTVLLGETASTGVPSLHESHGIGALVFGTDGTLLVTCGDGASYGSTDIGSASETYYQQALNDGIITNAQNVGAYRCQQLSSTNGKILRIDPATGNGIPSNPFYQNANPGSTRSKVWSRGVRNPYRMTKIPNSGSHQASDGDPGTFLFGDVGWATREELNVIDGPGLNFGWPKYEGMTYEPGYDNSTFTPSSHELPKIDYRNTLPPRAFVNGVIYDVGSPQVPGPNFNGNASTGGVWYTGEDFPEEYKNTYFHGDYGEGWIRNFRFDENMNPIEVKNFINLSGPAVSIGTDPNTGSLYYVRYPDQIRKVSYNPGNTNQAPIAKIVANTNFGTSPLNVSFTGDQSFDPENQNLTYSWNFGDGSPLSAAANPSHVFSTSSGQPTSFNVVLTVTDNGGLTDSENFLVSINNTPPNIVSTSVDNISTFNYSAGATLNLTAVVTDAEHSQGQLTYEWTTSLFHNDHMHDEPTDSNPSTSTVLSPIGCDGEATYWYRVTLKVTDEEGLFDVAFKDIYPNCPGTTQVISFGNIADKLTTAVPFNVSASANSGLSTSIVVASGPASILNNTVTLTGVPGTVVLRALQEGNGTYAPAKPVERSFDVNVDSDPSSCNADGIIYQERWDGIPGYTTDLIPVSTTPDLIEPLNILEIPIGVGDNYGTRIRGYLCAPVSGNYVFWVSGDDNSEFWLSSDENPANKSLIANVPNWTNPREWDKYPEQRSANQFLVAGETYYIEALMKENIGGDNLAVGWQLPGGILERPIPGIYLSPFNTTGTQDQTINFPVIPNKETTDGPFSINATASSNLPVSFSIVSGPASISGNTITLNGNAGTVTVRASQGGNAQYNPAPNVNRTFTVSAPGLLNQTISFPAIADRTTTSPPFELSATASSGLPVSYTVLSGPAAVSGNVVFLNGNTGTVSIRASQGGNAQYNAAPNVTRTFDVTEDTGPGNYCNSIGEQPWVEWIENVEFGDINNESFKERYGDFTNLSTDVTVGNTYPIALTPQFSWLAYNEYWRVWIDFNRDGDFADSGERVLNQNSSNFDLITGNITIPANASAGSTRMRVAMKNGSYPGPCETFVLGEVEDYTVNIINGGGGVITYNSCPNDITVTANAGATSAQVTWTQPSASTTCPEGGISVSQTQGSASGSSFTIGQHQITYNATDNCSNARNCGFTITVLEDSPACNNVTSGGTIAGSQANCGAYDPATITNSQTPTGGSGTIQYQWQRSTSGAGGPWTNVSGGGRTYNPGTISQSTWYRRLSRRAGCTDYDGVSNVIIKEVSNCGSGYCESSGSQPWIEWMTQVTFAGIDNESSKEQYGNFTSQTAQVVRGNAYPFSASLIFSWDQFDEHFRVWIDYNQDEDFDDAGEMVLQGISPAGNPPATPAGLSGSISIPSSALLGTTRMRVAMKRGSYAGPCEDFVFGEVEDYSVNISGNSPQALVIPEVLDLKAAQRQLSIDLQWTTNTSFKTDRFVIEKSIDGQEFEMLSLSENIVDTDDPYQYNLVDELPHLGMNHYRIKQFLSDGQVRFSEIRSIEINVSDKDYLLYPNPASSILFVDLKKFAGRSAIVQVFNAFGQPVDSRKINLIENEVSIDLSSYLNGIYTISIQVDNLKRYGTHFVVNKNY